MVFGKQISVSTKGFSDIIDVTLKVNEVIHQSKITNGLVCVAVIGSTASVTTIEFEPALVQDFKDKLEEIAAHDQPTRHSETWGDDNGFSHIRASLMGPGICLPVQSGRVVVGTWQQIVVIDHDNRPRTRPIFIQVVGE
ncbi:MAG: YjbQ family protein [Chlorobiales bacterium]|nr:YjbQ family protein [Chlorobiales bacterium]